MNLTCEISLYPLVEHYEATIIEVIKTLKKCDGVEVNTHAMSTFLKGKPEKIFAALSAVYGLESMRSSPNALVIKIINKDLPVEAGFLNFA